MTYNCLPAGSDQSLDEQRRPQRHFLRRNVKGDPPYQENLTFNYFTPYLTPRRRYGVDDAEECIVTYMEGHAD